MSLGIIYETSDYDTFSLHKQTSQLRLREYTSVEEYEIDEYDEIINYF